MVVPGRVRVAALVCAMVWPLGGLAEAATIVVPAGGDLQAALNAAQPGDVVTLAAGATFSGNFVLPNKGAATLPIVVRSSTADSLLPPAGVRITPAYAPLLAKIKSPNSTSALRTAAAAHDWTIMLLEFQSNQNGYGDIVALGAGDTTQTTLAQVPYSLTVDRVYVHGDPILGQKRGIALHSRDTIIVNSYIAGCKSVGQDSQAIGGFNGPGNYLIENNYLEGAAENMLFGGADPTIPNLVTANVTVRHNYMSKPLAWRNAIIATPVGVAAVATAGAGSLPAGVYSYKVVARTPAGQGVTATSTASAEASTTLTGASGAVTISWTPVAGATDYLVYGRASGAENVYWKTTSPYFADTGAVGSAGTPPSATKWSVKNILELKNAQDVLIEGNVFENLWMAAQQGYPIVFTPRNQGGTAPWTVVQRVTFRDNLVRHTAGGVTILGTDNLEPSLEANHIVVANNVFDDLTAATWGAGSRPFEIGDGGDAITIDHNTVITTDTCIFWLYGGTVTAPTPITNAQYTNNMSMHNSYGIQGSGYSAGLSTIAAYLPSGIVEANVLAGGKASSYPAGNYFPTAATWQAGFVNYAAGDYTLAATSPYKNAGTDGADLGADIAAVNAGAAVALSGDDRSTAPVHIITTTLPDAMLNTAYSQAVSCTGGLEPCEWLVVGGALPQGLSFDAPSGVIAGTPTAVESGAISLEAFDPALPSNVATATLSIVVDAPPLVLTVPAAPPAQVGVLFAMRPSSSGSVGAPIWSIASGNLPAGVSIDPSSGAIAGTPVAWGTTTALVQVQDSWSASRTASAPLTVSVAPAMLQIATATLPSASVKIAYQAALTSTGGTGATTWSVASGALPAGLTLSPSGIISGAAMAVGTVTFVVQASDANWPGNVATQSMTLTVNAREIILYAADAAVVRGTWSLVLDSTAAGGSRIWNPDKGVPKLAAPLASPANYVEFTFQAEAGVPYHFWLRGKADANSWANDSVFIQFSSSATAAGASTGLIGTTSGWSVNLEDCSGCGLSGWGWQDNGWGVAVMGPDIYFTQAGPQTLRVQIREDGFSIDQIVLSASKYLTTSPGALKNDTTILSR